MTTFDAFQSPFVRHLHAQRKRDVERAEGDVRSLVAEIERAGLNHICNIVLNVMAEVQDEGLHPEKGGARLRAHAVWVGAHPPGPAAFLRRAANLIARFPSASSEAICTPEEPSCPST